MQFTIDIPVEIVQSILDCPTILMPWSISGIEWRCRDTERIQYEVAEIVCSLILKEFNKQKRLTYNKK